MNTQKGCMFLVENSCLPSLRKSRPEWFQKKINLSSPGNLFICKKVVCFWLKIFVCPSLRDSRLPCWPKTGPICFFSWILLHYFFLNFASCLRVKILRKSFLSKVLSCWDKSVLIMDTYINSIPVNLALVINEVRELRILSA